MLKSNNWLKIGWQKLLGLERIYQIYLLLSAIFYGVVPSFSSTRQLLINIPTIPVTQWHIETWAIAVAVFVILFSIPFFVGKAFYKKKPNIPPAKPLSIVPVAFGTWNDHPGPIKAKFQFAMTFWVTLDGEKRANIVKCEMENPTALTDISIFAEHDRHLLAQFYVFKPGEPVLVQTSFYFDKINNRTKSDHSSNVTLTDSYGNTYTYNCIFKYQPLEKPRGKAKTKTQNPD
jgi:hypothetical protein